MAAAQYVDLARARGIAVGVRAVLLDMDGTLYEQRPLRRAMLGRLLREVAISPRQGSRTLRVLQAYRSAQEALRLDRVEDARRDRQSDTGSAAAEAQLRVAARRAGVSEGVVAEIVARWMEGEVLPILAAFRRPWLVEFLRASANRGMPLGLVSDYPAAAKAEVLGVHHFMSVIVCAHDAEVGAFKPDPRGLLVAAERLGVPPGETIYIGDRPHVDAAAASAAGMRCVIIGVQRPAPRGAAWFGVPDFDTLQRILFPT